tara:strand:- start:98 stop:529 length:432 start_codon:yes stop_codon:yes gene_type:complete
MFGFSKQEMAGKLDDLTQKAIVLVHKFISNKKFKVNGSVLEDSENRVFAAAITNYLFSRDHSQQHLDKFTSKQIESSGLQLIKSDNKLREMVVQSQKAVYIVQYGFEPSSYPNLTEILIMYGEEFPKVPNPASYELLMLSSLD